VGNDGNVDTDCVSAHLYITVELFRAA